MGTSFQSENVPISTASSLFGAKSENSIVAVVAAGFFLRRGEGFFVVSTVLLSFISSRASYPYPGSPDFVAPDARGNHRTGAEPSETVHTKSRRGAGLESCVAAAHGRDR